MSRKQRKVKSKKPRSVGEAAKLVKRRLGAGPHLRPDDYSDWIAYFMENDAPPKPYKSWLEYRLFREGALSEIPYEPEVFPYEQNIQKIRKYTPDGVKDAFTWFEVKGRFRDKDESDKYLYIRDAYPGVRLIFVFHSKNVRMPGARKRKDGSFRTHEEWAEDNGFDYTFESGLADWMKKEGL